jgi:Domain of unknown function (DUF6458)
VTIGSSLFLISVGAILRYAVTDNWDAVNVPTVGLILMLVGALGLALGIYFTFVRRDPRVDRPLGEPPPPPRY